MSDPRDRAHGDADLRRMRMGRPDPALRQRTLGAVRAALEATSEPTWRAWRVELSLAAAIVVCALLMPAPDRRPAEPMPLAKTSLAVDASEKTLLEPLELNHLEPYIRYRLDLAGRHPDPKPAPRYPSHDLSSRSIDLL